MRSAIARTLKSAGVITDEVFTVGFLLQPPGGGSPAGRASSVRVQTNQGMFSDRGCAPTPSSAGMGGVENDGSSNAYIALFLHSPSPDVRGFADIMQPRPPLRL